MLEASAVSIWYDVDGTAKLLYSGGNVTALIKCIYFIAFAYTCANGIEDVDGNSFLQEDWRIVTGRRFCKDLFV